MYKYFFISFFFLSLTSLEEDPKEKVICKKHIENQLNGKFKLKETKTFKEGQVKHKFVFEVDGVNADSVEQFLINELEMDSLDFVCCGWESNNGRYIDFGEKTINGKKLSFIGSFYSEETLINDRTKWKDIPTFKLEIEVIDL